MTKQQQKAIAANEKAANKKHSAATSDENPNNKDEVDALVVQLKYMPAKMLRQLFEAPDQLYTINEIKDTFFEYCKQHKLETQGQQVQLDKLLSSILFPNMAEAERPNVAMKKFISDTLPLLGRLHYCIQTQSDTAPPKFLQGPVPSIQMSVQTKKGNKKITRVLNLEVWRIDPLALANRAKKLFSCSTSLEPQSQPSQPAMPPMLPSKGRRVVVIQGSVVDKLKQMMVEQYGVPHPYLEVVGTRK